MRDRPQDSQVNSGVITLGAGTSTVFVRQRIGQGNFIALHPLNATAAGLSGVFATCAKNQFTVTHPGTASGAEFGFTVHVRQG